MEEAQQATSLLLPHPQQPPPQLEPGTIRKKRVKLGSGVVLWENLELVEDLHPVVEFQEVEAAVVLAGRHPTLKLPYRVCSIVLIWTHESFPTQAGAKLRSDKTSPGTLMSMLDKVKGCLHQLHLNIHLLSVVYLSILAKLGHLALILWVQVSVLLWFHLLGPLGRAGRAAATVAVAEHLCLGELNHLQAPA